MRKNTDGEPPSSCQPPQHQQVRPQREETRWKPRLPRISACEARSDASSFTTSRCASRCASGSRSAISCISGLWDYSATPSPSRSYNELSVLVVTFTMTAPMTAWMLYRRMPRQTVWEMSATMPILAFILLTLGRLGVVPMGDVALLEHGLMMPAMLVPMLLRPGLYARHRHHAHA